MNLRCRDAWDWEVEVKKNFARAGEVLCFDPRDWDTLRGDPEFADMVAEHDREEEEYKERVRRLSQEAMQGRNDYARQIEQELRAEHRRLHPEEYSGDGIWEDYAKVDEEKSEENQEKDEQEEDT